MNEGGMCHVQGCREKAEWVAKAKFGKFFGLAGAIVLEVPVCEFHKVVLE